MTVCPDQSTLCRLLDGQLPEAECQAVMEHVETCSVCQQALGEQTAAVPLLLLPLPATVPLAPGSEGPAATPEVPGYDLFEELGRGGMGVVYRARQMRLERIVALKLIRPEVLGHPSTNRGDVMARFRTEALAAAQIGHAHIIPIHEVGEADGCLFYAMHFVDGPSLASVRQGGPLPGPKAVAYLEPIARALQCAHEHGILHRDVKPANILLDSQEHPYLADFGVAQWRETVRQQTHSGVLLGTPEFMSPEQASDPRSVGPTGDVYSLGATLYDLLTGRPPFQAASGIETLRQLLHDEPVPPRRLNPAIDRDLETIVLKCLDKEPARRYASAAALADELERYRNGRPILARPLGRLARLERWARRHPGTAGASTLAGASLLALLVLAVVTSVQQRSLRQEAEQAYRRERLQSAQTSLLYAITRCEAGDVGEGLLLFARTLRLLPTDEPALEREVRLQLAAWSAGYRPVVPLAYQGRVVKAVFSTDARLLATGGAEGHVLLWDADSGERRVGPLFHPDKVNALAFSLDGRLLATACEDGKARLWRVSTGEAVGEPLPHHEAVLAVAFSPDGSTLATGCGRTPGQSGEAALWSVSSGERLARLQVQEGKPVRSLAFSPDGHLLAAAGEERVVRLWDVERRQVRHHLPVPEWIHGLAYDPKGRTLAVWNGQPEVSLWDLGGETPRIRPLRGPHPIVGLTYSPDGQALWGIGEVGSAGELRCWDVASGQPCEAPRGTLFPARSLAMTADDVVRLASVGWNPRLGAAPLRPPALATFRQDEPLRCAAWSPDRDGAHLLIGGESRLTLWDRNGARLQQVISKCGPINAVGWSADGHRVAASGVGKTTEIRAMPGLDLLTDPLPHDAWVYANRFTPDGRTLCTADEDGLVRTWDLSASPPRPQVRLQLKAPVHGSALSADGTVFVTGTRDGLVRRWRTDTWEQVGPTLDHPGPVFCVALSSDGQRLLTGCQDRAARLWDVETGRLAGRLLRHPAVVGTVALAAGGELAATGCGARGAGEARFWQLQSGRPLGPPLHHAEPVFVVTFSPDGQTLLSGSADGVARLWPAPQPLEGDRAAIEAGVQALAAMALDEAGTPRPLDAARWALRRQEAERPR